jgi:tetratricopeptide (TPR) repeat protein
MNETLDEINRTMDFEWQFQAAMTKCEMLAIDGKNEESVELLTEKIEKGRQNNSQRTLPLALAQRARVRLDIGDVSGASADAKESLMRYRAMGWKIIEPDLYEMRAQCLSRQGQYAGAMQTWLEAYQMCEGLKLHHRSLQMLLGIAALQLRLGDRVALERAWAAIDAFVRAHPDLPEPTKLRLRLARLDYLKFQGDAAGLSAALQQTQRFVEDSHLTPFQLRAWTAYKHDGPLATVSLPTQPQATVDLQPILTTTRVATGELAHARFALVNPSERITTGSVRLTSLGLNAAWAPTDQGWKITFSKATNMSVSTKFLSIVPGTATALYLEATPQAPEATNTVSVLWQGVTNLEARWEFGATAEVREVAVVNASLAEGNPFYLVTFYHELYYRGQGRTIQNLRVTASQPCRIEIADASTGQILAIDANGNGTFGDSGDVLTVDADRDGFPDFMLNPNRDLASFELIVYPASGPSSLSRETEITLWHRELGGWVADAVDILRTSKE